MPSIGEIFSILEQYKYWVIFPIAVLEGPILSIISGFLYKLGAINPYISFVLLLLGDLISGSFYFWMGKVGRGSVFLSKYGRVVGYEKDNIAIVEEKFHRHLWKTLLLSKFAYGLSGTVQVMAGIVGVSFSKFLLINTVGDAPKIIGLMYIGYYFGNSYENINQYLHSIASIFLGLLVLMLVIFWSKMLAKKFFNKNPSMD